MMAVYANPSDAMGAAFTFSNNTVRLDTNATLLRVDLKRANSSNYTFVGNSYVVTGAGRVQFSTGAKAAWGTIIAQSSRSLVVSYMYGSILTDCL